VCVCVCACVCVCVCLCTACPLLTGAVIGLVIFSVVSVVAAVMTYIYCVKKKALEKLAEAADAKVVGQPDSVPLVERPKATTNQA
jgi:hypothetical protein